MKLAIVCVAVSTALSQNAPLPRFSTASITPTDERVSHPGGAPFAISGQRIEGRSIPVGALVTEGWHLPAYQVIWPEQPLGDTFNVSVTIPKGTTPEKRSLMFQELLADRFGFRYHWQPKDLPIYALEIAPGGLKMRKAPRPPAESIIINKYENNSWHIFRIPHPPSPAEPASRMEHLNVYSIDELVSGLRPAMLARTDRPVIDQTGLQGYFNVDLYVPCPADGCRMKEWSDAVFFDTLEKQLGLRAVEKTMPVKLLVIDHLERAPTGK